jgi:hypothetical protein
MAEFIFHAKYGAFRKPKDLTLVEEIPELPPVVEPALMT